MPLSPRTPLGAIGILGLSFALVWHLPALSVGSSLAATFAVLYVLAIAAEVAYWLVLYPAFFTPFKHLPVPPGRSIWNGHAPVMAGQPTGEPSRKWMEEIPNNGLIRHYLMLNVERILVISPRGLSELLTQKAYDFEKPTDTAYFLSLLLGDGLLTAEGEKHKVQRRNLNPAFSYRHVKELYPVFWQKGAEMVNAMEKSIETLPPHEKVVTLADWASRVSLDIIGLAGMGQAFNAIPDPNNTLYRKYKSMFGEGPAKLRKIRLVLFILSAAKFYFRWFPSEYNRKLFEGSNYVRNFSRRIIQEKKEKMAKNEHVTTDIISVALESGCFTEESLVDQVMTFLAAGHETTATALQWAAYALCTHPDMQKRLREEIRSSLPSISDPNTSTITASQIDSLPYLNAFCNEVLRYHPPVRITVRQAARDTSLCETFIPKGTYISIAPQALNRSTELWGPDANEFDPERWLKPGKAHTGGAESNYAFLTFLHGPRSCIGSAFAKGELACLVAALVSKFDIELENPDMELQYTQELTTKPKGGVRLRIKAAA